MNARRCMAAEVHVASKQVPMQTKPSELEIPAWLRASPSSSEAAEGKAVVLTPRRTTTHGAAPSVCKQGKPKNSTLIIHQEGAGSPNQTSQEPSALCK